MTHVRIDPGICGRNIALEVIKTGRRRVTVRIESDCEMVLQLSELLADISLLDALKTCIDSDIYKYASVCKLHTACPVPMAILKAIEVEFSLALPRPVSLRFEDRD